MKEGLISENDQLVYYKHGEPYHAGVIQVDGDIYYISAEGKAVKGQHIVHEVMSNGILKKGTYTFGEDYKLVKGSYIAPKKRKNSKKVDSQKQKRHRKRALRSAKKTALQLLPVAVGIAALVALVLLLPGLRTDKPPVNATEVPGDSLPDTNLIVSLPTFQEEVLLCSELAKQVYDHQMDIVDAAASGSPYRPFVFTYQLNRVSGVLYLSESQNMADAVEYPLPADKTSLVIDNLKTGTDYYYLVRVGEEEQTGQFRTARSNRYITVPGAANIRDIGGYVTLDGKIVRQGLLIRGVELDGLANTAYFLTSDAIAQMQNTFGFVYDMDLRSDSIFSGVYSSRLGEGVGHKFYNSCEYGQIFSQNAASGLRNIFRDLADPEKYPMYLHCTWGQDRTGTIVFLLQGILNVPQEDMILEYKQTGYTNQLIAQSHNMDIIISGMEPYAGDTLQEKIVTFLTTVVGVEEAEIQSIRRIFLEDPVA